MKFIILALIPMLLNAQEMEVFSWSPNAPDGQYHQWQRSPYKFLVQGLPGETVDVQIKDAQRRQDDASTVLVGGTPTQTRFDVEAYVTVTSDAEADAECDRMLANVDSGTSTCTWSAEITKTLTNTINR